MALNLENLRALITESDKSVKKKKKKKKKRKRKNDDQNKWVIRKRKKSEKKRVPISKPSFINKCSFCQYFFNEVEFKIHKTTCSARLKFKEEKKAEEEKLKKLQEKTTTEESTEAERILQPLESLDLPDTPEIKE